MFSTILIYSLLMLIGVVGSYVIINTNKQNSRQRNLLMFFFLFLLSIPIGGRYEVGSDWEHYRYLFLDVSKNGLTFSELFTSNYEPLYLTWNYLISIFTDSSSVYFTFTAFAIFFILYKANKDYEFLFPLLLFFFFASLFGASMNITRQVLSGVIFYYATYYNNDKKKMIVFLLLSIFMHYSSVIFLVSLFLDKKIFNILDNTKIVLLLYCLCILCGTTFYSLFIRYLPIDMFSDKYVNSVNSDATFELSSGLGTIATHVVNMLLIVTSTKVRTFFSNKRIDLLYRCFYLGCFLSAFMGYSIFLSRLPFGLTSIKLFLLSYTIFYLSYKVTLPKLAAKYFFIVLFLMFFIIGILNSDNGCSPYTFNWL